MALTRGDIVKMVADDLGDPDFGDFHRDELQRAVNRALNATVVAAKAKKMTVSVALVADTTEYTATGLFEVLRVAHNALELDRKFDGDKATILWPDTTGVPVAWTPLTGNTFQINCRPDAPSVLITMSVLGYAGVPDPVPSVACTVQNTGDTVTKTTHGLVNGDGVIFGSVTGGVEANVSYFVISAATSTFQVSQSRGGTAYAITADGSNTYVEDAITELPEDFLTVTVLPMAKALALENRRTGTANLLLSDVLGKRWQGWVERIDAAMRPKK